MSNTVDFIGSGKDIVELMKKALCDFENIRIDVAVLTSPDKSIKDGTTVISLLIDIPEEDKWVSIYYTHYDEGLGYGSISYQNHDYRDQPFPERKFEKGRLFAWGNGALTEDEILDEVFERKKCHKTI